MLSILAFVSLIGAIKLLLIIAVLFLVASLICTIPGISSQGKTIIMIITAILAILIAINYLDTHGLGTGF